ncbi:hypothetical protein N7491_009902 [Penicillium cf. griseofulvum]|nr:hypothetical protein N7491_009902 [Penicillium cf. griseofulvum]
MYCGDDSKEEMSSRSGSVLSSTTGADDDALDGSVGVRSGQESSSLPPSDNIAEKPHSSAKSLAHFMSPQ